MQIYTFIFISQAIFIKKCDPTRLFFRRRIVIFAFGNNATMEANKTYEAPTSTVVELKFEGILCQSDGIQSMRSGYGEALEDEWN